MILVEASFIHLIIFLQLFSRNVVLPIWTSERNATVESESEGCQVLVSGTSGLKISDAVMDGGLSLSLFFLGVPMIPMT